MSVGRFFFPTFDEIRRMKEPYALSTIRKRLTTLSKMEIFKDLNLKWSVSRTIEFASQPRFKRFVTEIFFDCCDQNAKLTLVSFDNDKYVIDMERSSTVHIHEGQNFRTVKIKNQKIEEQKEVEKNQPHVSQPNLGLDLATKSKGLEMSSEKTGKEEKSEKQFKSKKKVTPIAGIRLGRSRIKRRLNPNRHYFNETFDIPRRMGKIIRKKKKQEKRVNKIKPIIEDSQPNLNVVQKVNSPIQVVQHSQIPQNQVNLQSKPIISIQSQNEQISAVPKENIRVEHDVNEMNQNSKSIIQQNLQEVVQMEAQMEKKIEEEFPDKKNFQNQNFGIEIEENQDLNPIIQHLSIHRQLIQVPQIYSFNISGEKEFLRHLPNNIQNEAQMPVSKYWDLNEQKVSEKTMNSYLIIEWSRKYCQKLKQKLTDLNSSHRFDLRSIREETIREEPFVYFPVINEWQKFEKLWIQSAEIMIMHNKFEKVQIVEKQPPKSSHQIIVNNNMFVSKAFKNRIVEEDKQKSQTVYLSSFPLNISKKKYSISLVLAYILSPNLSPSLIWFSFYQSQEEEKVEFFHKQSKCNHILTVLQRSLKIIKAKRLRFIYTTLSREIHVSLFQLQQKLQINKSSTEISFSMHIQCFKSFLNEEFCRRNTNFFKEISSKIRLAPNRDQLQQSYLYLVAKSFKFDESIQCLHPREIWKHFNTFSEVFSSRLNQHPDDQSNLSFLSSDFFGNKQKAQIKDPVRQINKLFCFSNSFRNHAEVILSIFTIFDLKSQEHETETNQSETIPKDLYWKEKEFLLYHQIFEKQYDIQGEVLFTKILQNPVYQFNLIVKHCPRLVVQVLYRLIQISQSIQEIEQETLDKECYFCYNIKTLENFQVIHRAKTHFNIQEQTQIIQERNEKEQTMDKKYSTRVKKWQCSCQFSQKTGIPCEHEIYFCISREVSLYDEFVFYYQ